ncbi:helix-turn-helix transcriptional regulator [Brevibacillus composti]|uniref:Helix-turn-helix transcriptional regulator n=1 Tax=Brevibacillus composti TaxID=2796470 RepID=A0A7T5EM80_9BACL|nr:helix-turn-helix transcriptional regulator [Brevibacillus composti]QQE75183.1 helix-turn-helix transcriptional regulator [Brevibacillus composti]
MQEKLAALRRYHNISQKEMADLIRVDLRTYINKENGQSQFKANEMFAIARKFQMPIDEIFLPTNFEKHEVS